MTSAPRHTDLEVTVALRWAVVGAVLLLVGVVLGVVLEAGDTDLLDADQVWNTFVGSFAPGLLPLSMVMNVVGAGVIATYLVPLGGALLLVLVRRPWGALYFLTATAVSAGTVQVLKAIFGRVRPEEMLVISDHGSFPSGHTANAATLAVVAVIVFPRLWVAIVGFGWVLLMGFSRTQVHAHWLTDTVGGAIIGAGVALLVAAAYGLPLQREWTRPLGFAAASAR
ncbi:phosphatase PAP2 family protein [Microbacterium telephonicum]|uniref:Undecaprenyl-diphosphatase n=1 Tax=Microbacterium telephonicum TaxID=1714841 RepID=A0A498CB74_9MICO|nr:phosphatase PAP2 family protein [Microbacterium telephonicum]RLK52915.1 undecaprenyl-diphosphatase [Microbacterium telephonicum]